MAYDDDVGEEPVSGDNESLEQGSYQGYEPRRREEYKDPGDWEPIGATPASGYKDPGDWEPISERGEGLIKGGARELAHTALPFAGGLAGAEALAPAGAALGALTSPVTGPIGPLVGGLAGAAVGALGGGWLGSKVESEGAKALGFDDSQIRAANQAEHPIGMEVARALPMAAAFSPTGATRLMRGVGALFGGGVEASQQLAQGEFDPARIAEQAALGGVFARPRWQGSAREAQFGDRPPPQEAPRVEPPPPPEAWHYGTEPEAGWTYGNREEMVAGNEQRFQQARERQGDLRAELGEDYGRAADNAQRDLTASTQLQGTPGAKGARGISEAQAPPPEIPVTGETAINPTTGDQRAVDGTRDRALINRFSKKAEVQQQQAAPPLQSLGNIPPDIQAAIQAREPSKPARPAPEAERAQIAAQPPKEVPLPVEPQRATTIPADQGKETIRAPEKNDLDIPDFLRRPAPPKAVVSEATKALGRELKIKPTESGYDLVKNGETVSSYPNHGEALKALNAAQRAAGGPTTEALRRPKGGLGKSQEAANRMATLIAQTAAKPSKPAWYDRVYGGAGGKPPQPPGGIPPQPPGGIPPQPPGGEPAPQRQTVQPATPHDLKTGVLASLRRMFNPLRSPSAREGAAALRSAYGTVRRVKEQAANRITNDIYKLSNRMTKVDYDKFVDAYESNKISSLPADQQKMAGVLKQGYDDFWKSIQQLPKHAQTAAVENYLTHMYDNSQGQVNNFISKWYGGGSSGSLRQRTHPTYADARKAGLTQLTNNPIENFVRYSEGISNYVGSRGALDQLERGGFIWRGTPKVIGASGSVTPQIRNAPPEGYAKIEIPWASKGFQEAYAPRDLAELLNNFYSQGIRAGQAKDFVNFLQQTKNIWTGLELGMSLYHPFTMAHESFASGLARSIKQIGSGDYTGALKSLSTAPIDWATAWKHGGHGMDVYHNRGMGTPTEQRIMGSLERANIRPGDLVSTGEYAMTNESHNPYATDYWTSYVRGALGKELKGEAENIAKVITRKGGDWKAAATFLPRQVARTMQTLSAPIFRAYIPRLKMSMMMKDMQAVLRAYPSITDKELDLVARKIADSIDNRFGEMVKDNLFMNKVAKETGMLMMRSFSWAFGAQREITGGAMSLFGGLAKGQNRLNMRNPETFDPRVAYSMAFPMSVALMSAAMQYLRTGEGPKDPRDLLVPRTGGSTKYGPERELLPGFQKDFIGFAYHPWQEAKNKLAAPWMTLLEQVMNEGWKNGKLGPIVKKNDTWGQAIKARAEHVGRKLIPIGVQSAISSAKPGSAITAPERFIGFRAPGSHLLKPAKLRWQ